MSKSAPDIAIFLRCLYEGGAERVMLNLARSFIERNLKVDFVLVTADGSFMTQIPPEIRLIDLKAPSKLSILPKLVQYLQQEHPATLLAALHYPSEIAIIAKRLAGVSTKVVVSEHNQLSQEAKHVPQLSARFTPLAAKLFYPWADRIIAVSEGVAKDLADLTRIPSERIQVIYNPVVVPEIFSKAEEPVVHPWFQSGEPPVILGVGRFYPQKDFSTLIRAFTLVRKVQPARLVLLGGSGPEEARLKALIGELDLEAEVAMLGYAENPYAYMAKAGVLVLSSIFEGFGNVLVEAMAVGTPVVSTNCKSGPAEILANGKYGLLTPVGDPQAMADAILTTLAGNTKKVDPGWIKQFTLEACTQKYLHVLGLA
jgi:glycosyltransferase involved in cell wall biosynthesis